MTNTYDEWMICRIRKAFHGHMANSANMFSIPSSSFSHT